MNDLKKLADGCRIKADLYAKASHPEIPASFTWIADEIDRILAVAQGKPDRDKLATMLKANGFTSRDGTYLQGGTYGVIDTVLSALSSTTSPNAPFLPQTEVNS